MTSCQLWHPNGSFAHLLVFPLKSRMTASTNTAVKDPGVPCPWAHLLLAGFALLPLVAPVPVNLNIVVTASLEVYVGCLRSIKPTPPEESMTRQVMLQALKGRGSASQP